MCAVNLWVEIEDAKDPSANFETVGKPPHPDSLGDSDQAGWCHRDAAEQHATRDKRLFRTKIIWHCKHRLSKGHARRNIENHFRYYMTHFDRYVELIALYPIYQGERGKSIIHDYMKTQRDDLACVFNLFISDAYERDFGRPGLAKTGLPSLIADLTKPMMLPELA